MDKEQINDLAEYLITNCSVTLEHTLNKWLEQNQRRTYIGEIIP